MLVGLLAARNAGIEVPDESIDKAIAYYKSMTSTGPARSPTPAAWAASATRSARISIATLVYAVARRKDLPEFKATLGYLKQRLEQPTATCSGNTPATTRPRPSSRATSTSWEKWNKLLVRQLKQAQQPDGSFRGQFGPAIATSMSLLALALNYRFLPIYER